MYIKNSLYKRMASFIYIPHTKTPVFPGLLARQLHRLHVQTMNECIGVCILYSVGMIIKKKYKLINLILDVHLFICSIMNTEVLEFTHVAFMQHLKKGRPMLTHDYKSGKITTEKGGELVFDVMYDLDTSTFSFWPVADYLTHVEIGKFKNMGAGEYWALAMVMENKPQ